LSFVAWWGQLHKARQAWLHGEGLELPVKMEYDETLAKQAYELADRWDANKDTPVDKLPFKDTDVANLNSNQKSQSGCITDN
jgi:leukotriene-A4 hydrolase